MIDLSNLEGFDNLDDLKKAIQKRVNNHNLGPMDDFDGLSPEEMLLLERDFPGGKSKLVMKKVPENILEKCPLLVQVRFLIDKLKGGNEIKLTKTGALPTKLVKEIYGLGALKNEWIEKGLSNLNKEGDAVEINITRIILELSSLAKKRKGKLSLTKDGERHADDGNFILEEILELLFFKFNWAYYDGYKSEVIGRINPAFSLFLLKKYGKEKKDSHFYAEKYFKAFPQLLVDGENSFRCYGWRTFELYFRFMGFVEIEKERIFDPLKVKKTKLVDQLFASDKI